MKKLALLTALVLALAGGAFAASTATAAPPQATGLTAPVTGTFTDALGGTGTFTGTYEIERFVNQNGGLAAVTTLTGTAVNSLGVVVGTVDQTVTVPLQQASGSCQILHLELGPLDLDLLGLVVHLDRVVLDITAEQGPGNLLGNLLCGIAGLLDSGATTNAIVRLLNQLLGLLG
jgi:hypothetical protein